MLSTRNEYKNPDKSRLINFEPNYNSYGFGFFVSKNLKRKIHKTWKLSDRTLVLPLITKDLENKSDEISDLKIRISQKNNCTSSLRGIKLNIKEVKIKNIITILNVYAPHTEGVMTNNKELNDLYEDLNITISSIKSSKDSSNNLVLMQS